MSVYVCYAAAKVKGIAYKGKADRGEMDTYLVGTSGGDAHFEQGSVGLALEDLDFALGWFTVRRYAVEITQEGMGIFTDGKVDGKTIGQIARPDEGAVDF